MMTDCNDMAGFIKDCSESYNLPIELVQEIADDYSKDEILAGILEETLDITYKPMN